MSEQDVSQEGKSGRSSPAEELLGRGGTVGAGSTQWLWLCLVSVPHRGAAQRERLGSVGPHLLGICARVIWVRLGSNWLWTEGKAQARVPCSPGARSSLKRREGAITCKLQKAKDQKERGQGEGVSLPGAPAACQDAEGMKGRWRQLPGSGRGQLTRWPGKLGRVA